MEFADAMKRSRAGSRRWRSPWGAPMLALTLACAGLQPVPGPEIVGRIGEREILRAELDKATLGEVLRLEVEHKRKIHQVQSQMLRYLIDSELIEAEAARRGVTPTELMQVEVRDPAGEVSEEELQTLYDRYAEKLEGGLEENREQLYDYLVQRKMEDSKSALLQRLQDEAGVEVLLPYPSLPTVQIAGGQNAPSKGPADASVTIVEFSDFQCPYCQRMQVTLRGLFESYPKQIRLEYRHFPLNSHPVAFLAAQASVCADEQGKFWEYHDGVFERQAELSEEKLLEIAHSVGLDVGIFSGCVEEPRSADLVRSDRAAGREVGVQGTPAFFVNGHPIFGADTESVFRELIERELAAQS